MALERNEIQRELAETARRFLTSTWQAEDLHRLRQTGEFPRELWRQAAELGWFDLLIPEAEGGLGLGAAEAGAILEEIGRALFPGPAWETMVLRPVLRHHGLALQEHAAIALGQLDAGLTPELDTITLAGHLLTGGQTIAGFADIADVLVLAAREGNEPVLAAVDPGAPGLRMERLPSVDPVDRPCLVTAAGAPVLAVLARGAGAAALLERLTRYGCVLSAAEMLGVCDRVLEMSVEYVGERKQFGRAIGSFQAIQHELADVAMRCRTLRSVCYLSQYLLDAGPDGDAGHTARVAKAYASRSVRQTVESGLQVHGGIGFTGELLLHLYFKRALTLQSALGDERHHQRALGRRLLSRMAEATPAAAGN